MTTVQINNAIAQILDIPAAQAAELANHLMASILGRPTSESTSFRLSPPMQANVLTTPELMPTRLLNNYNTAIQNSENTVNGFNTRMTEAVGNHIAGQADEETFQKIGSNLIQAVYNLKVKMDGLDIELPDDLTDLLDLIKEHLADKDNPHQTTASQVGAVSLTQFDEFTSINATTLTDIKQKLSNNDTSIYNLQADNTKIWETINELDTTSFTVMTETDINEIWERVFG